MHHSRVPVRERAMHRYDVGCGEDTVDIQRVPARMYHLHAEGLPYFLHSQPYAPVPDDAEGFSRELDLIRFPERNMGLPAPAPAMYRIVVVADAVRKLED